MSTFSTASNFITKINEFYPIAGQDNSSQGFRDNFKNTKVSLELLDEDVNNLKINSVVLTNPINDFSNNIIKQAIFQDCGTVVFDTTTEVQTSDVTLDYKNGGFQKYKINEGTHSFSVSNWPGTNRSGSMILYITTSSASATYVNFSAVNVYNYGSEFPVLITGPKPALFQLWSDGDSDNLYVKQL